jgi:uncharacterized protein YciI
MFVILLKFSTHKAKAGQFMEGHNSWLRTGFEKGVFLLSGSIQPKAGGAVLAHNATPEQIQAIVNEDPFVAEGVVAAEIVEISASKSVPELEFLISR